MENKLLLIGGGGHCHSVIDSILSAGIFKEIGVVAKDQDNYKELTDDDLIAPYLVGTDKELPKLLENGWNCAFVTLGSVGNTKGRRVLCKTISELGFEIPTIIDPSAVVSRKAVVENGVFIGKRAVVNTGTKVGDCAIINTGAIIEHDCVIGDFAHISPGTTLCGQVSVGNGHKMNLRAFVYDKGYKIYYLHKGVESLDVEEMVVSPITKVEESGYDELRILQEATKYIYSGTLISPPELYRTFIFLERKNENGLYKDRGLITLYFPQDRVLKKKEYFCGVGIMLSLDRNEKNKDILIQRVVMLREDHIIDDEAKTLIWDILNQPMNGGVLISVADTEQLHRRLYKHYHRNDDEIS